MLSHAASNARLCHPLRTDGDGDSSPILDHMKHRNGDALEIVLNCSAMNEDANDSYSNESVPRG